MLIKSPFKNIINQLPHSFLGYSGAFLSGICGAWFALVIAHPFMASHSSIGTVNVTGLIDQFIQEEIHKNLSPDVLRQEVKAFGIQLEKELKVFARQNHLVLLPSEAIVAGSPDYTAFIDPRLVSRPKGDG